MEEVGISLIIFSVILAIISVIICFGKPKAWIAISLDILFVVEFFTGMFFLMSKANEEAKIGKVEYASSEYKLSYRYIIDTETSTTDTIYVMTHMGTNDEQ